MKWYFVEKRINEIPLECHCYNQIISVSGSIVKSIMQKGLIMTVFIFCILSYDKMQNLVVVPILLLGMLLLLINYRMMVNYHTDLRASDNRRSEASFLRLPRSFIIFRKTSRSTKMCSKCCQDVWYKGSLSGGGRTDISDGILSGEVCGDQQHSNLHGSLFRFVL